MKISDLLSENAAHVLALTIIENNGENHVSDVQHTSRILVGVRNPETNSTHPNVLSVPTKRIPSSLISGIDIELLEKVDRRGTTTYLVKERVLDARQSGHNPLYFAAKSVLAEKLGLAEALENELVTFECRLQGLVVGTVYHPDHNELTNMYNSTVFLSGSKHIPEYTSSYSKLIWTEVEKFMKSAADKDLMCISEELNPVEFCMHGLCVMSTYNVLANNFVVPEYPF